MTASTVRLLLSALVLPLSASGALLAAPAAAQDDPGDKVNMVIVYGDDQCPESNGGEIVVCARKPDSERYRIPEDLRHSDDPRNTSWTRTVESLETVGKSGVNSCSPVGAGGFTGCTQKLVDQAYAEKAHASSIRFGKLIEKKREARLSTIDADAAAEQKRVEAIEAEYNARLKKESEADTGNAAVDNTPPPALNAATRQPPVTPSKDTKFDDGDQTERNTGDPTAPAQVVPSAPH